MKKNEIGSFVETWMNLETVIQNEDRKRKTNIASVLVYPYKNDLDYKVLVFRIQTMNPMPIIQDLRNAGYELLWPNDGLGLT